MQVPFIDLSRPTQHIKERYMKAVGEFLDRSNFILSPEVDNFEKQWAEYIGTQHCVGVSSGADALYLALVAVGVGPGDEVVTQGTAYNASVTAILRTGATPRFADVDPENLTVVPEHIEALITDKTKAIMPVHLYGQAANMEAIMALAKKHGLKVIEDCAQAHGAAYQGTKVGAWGDLGAFSFYPTKNLGAFGDAGALTLNHTAIDQELRARRNLGQVTKNDHQYLGTNMRLDGLHAIALSLKLEFLDQEIAKRQKLAARYDALIAEKKLPIKPVARLAGSTHVYHLYVVQSRELRRDTLATKLAERGLGTAVHYPIPVYRQPFYRGAGDACPVTDALCASVLSLPMYAELTEAQQDQVVAALSDIFSR